MLRDELADCYGGEWRAVADDLDNAIAEYGGWVEGKIRDRIEAYAKEVARSNRGIKDIDAHAEPDRERMRQLADEEVQYWVHGVVRRYYSAMNATASGGIAAGGGYYMERTVPATYKTEIDLDFSAKAEEAGDVIQVWLESNNTRG